MTTKVTIATPDDLAVNDGRAPTDASLHDKVIHALRSVMDPELPVNLYDLGLIYDLQTPANGAIRITMTLTAPNCPVADQMPAMVQKAVLAVPGTTSCNVTLTFDPPWDKSRLSDAARLELGLM